MEDFKRKKILFLVFQELPTGNGITKKILAQKKGLINNGFDVYLGYFERINDRILFKVENEIIHIFGRDNIWTSFKKKCYYSYLHNYIIKHNINKVYLRYVHTGNPCMNLFFSKLKHASVDIYMEIPTYPYDRENCNKGFFNGILYWIEKKSRQKFSKYISRIITFTNDKYIFGVKTITISNGLDFSNIDLVDHKSLSNKQLICIGVAHINFWHGYDRFIEGLKNYYKKEEFVLEVIFNIIGDGDPKYIELLKRKVMEYNLGTKVFFLGKHEDKELTADFKNAHLAIGCLGCHRKGVENVKALKNIEYAARGVPFIYSEINEDFDHQQYIYKVPPDDSPIDIDAVINFYNRVNLTPGQIRQTIKHLSWENQMSKLEKYF